MKGVLIFALMNAAIIVGHVVAAIVILALGQALIRGQAADHPWAWAVVVIAGIAAGVGVVCWLAELPSKGQRHGKHCAR